MEFGAVSFQVRLDLSSIDREIRQLQQRLDGRDLRVQLRPDGADVAQLQTQGVNA